MKILDASHIFKNIFQHDKLDRKIILHWTGSNSVRSTIDWLSSRLDGKGTVGYNYIIDTNGDVYKCCPSSAWFHNTGLGSNFDKGTISIAFVSSGDFPSRQQIKSLNILIETSIAPAFNILEITHHAALNSKKQDFPDKYWDRLKHYIDFIQ